MFSIDMEDVLCYPEIRWVSQRVWEYWQPALISDMGAVSEGWKLSYHGKIPEHLGISYPRL